MPEGRRFEPGNPGRPKGSRNKLGEAFISALADDFDQHGPEVIAQVRLEKPDVYMKVCASILPKELTVTTNDGLTDEQARARLAELASVLGSLLYDPGNPGGGGAEGEGDPSRPIH